LTKPTQTEHVRLQCERWAECGHPDQQADRRPGDGDQTVGAGAGRLAVEPGDATERPQIDRLGAHSVVARHHRVAELVREDRREERDGGHDAAEEAQVGRQQHAEPHGDDRHAPVCSHGNAGVGAEADRTGGHDGGVLLSSEHLLG
jgi:hypothetical protein